MAGRLAASGDFREIRRLMTNRPHVFAVQSSDDRRLAVALMGEKSVSGVEIDGIGLTVRAVRLRQLHPGAAAHRPRRGHPAAQAAAVRRVPGERLLLPAGGMMSTVACITARGSVRPPPGAAAAAAAAAAGRPGAALPGVRREPRRVGRAGPGRPRPGRGAAGDRADRRHRRARLRDRRRHDRAHPDQAAAAPGHHPGQAGRGGRRSPRSPRPCRCSSPAAWPSSARLGFGAGRGRGGRARARTRRSSCSSACSPGGRCCSAWSTS